QAISIIALDVVISTVIFYHRSNQSTAITSNCIKKSGSKDEEQTTKGKVANCTLMALVNKTMTQGEKNC
ncbi:unnamed protein product, partial [Musa hybrid cultivar]